MTEAIYRYKQQQQLYYIHLLIRRGEHIGIFSIYINKEYKSNDLRILPPVSHFGSSQNSCNSYLAAIKSIPWICDIGKINKIDRR